MSDIVIDQPIPDFTCQTAENTPWQLSEQRGHHVVLYFFPRANTPGCTTESEAFRDLDPRFGALNTIIVGISRDKPKTLANFRDKYGFPFTLLSDPDETVCNLFGVMRDKNMYGKKVRGIERSTFLIDSAGVLRQEWRKVSVDGHAEAVLEAVANLGG